MISLEICARSFLVVLLMLTILYLIGGMVRKVLFKTCYVSAYDIFINLIIGIIVLIFLYSVIITRGVTMSWFYLLLFFMYFTVKKKNDGCINENIDNNEPARNQYKYIILTITWAGLIYSYLFINNCEINGAFFRPIEIDNYHYATIARYLNDGYESMNVQALITGNIATNPYHYGEIWITAFIMRFFDLNPLFTYSVVTHSIVLVIILFGFLSIWEAKNKKTHIAYLIGFVFLLFVTDFAYIYKKFITSEYLYGENRAYVLNMLKQSFLALFILVCIIMATKKKKCELFFSLLLIMPIFFFSTPAICSIIGGYFIMSYIKNKKIEINYAIPFLIFVSSFICYILITNANFEQNGDSSFIRSIPWYKMRLLITNFILYGSQYIHFIIVICLICSMKMILALCKRLWIPLLCFWFGTITSSVIMRGYNSIAVQFISSVYASILAMLIPSIILYSWYRCNAYSKLKKTTIFISIFFSFAVGIYTINELMSRKLYPISDNRKEYEKSVAAQIAENENINIGVFWNYPKFDFSNNFVINYGTIQSYLDAYFDNINYFQLNIAKQYYLQYETLYSKGLKNTIFNKDEYLMQFINNYNIEFIIVRPDAVLPASLAMQYVCAAQDKTGEKFYKKINKR